MTEGNPSVQQVDQFIHEQIATVPHLEALLLAWNARPKTWSVVEMASALYVSPELAEEILSNLTQQDLLEEFPNLSNQYRYKAASEEQNRLIALVATTYRHELIRLSRMIHAKAPTPLQEFARAFRFTKEKKEEREEKPGGKEKD